MVEDEQRKARMALGPSRPMANQLLSSPMLANGPAVGKEWVNQPKEASIRYRSIGKGAVDEAIRDLRSGGSKLRRQRTQVQRPL